MEAGCCNEGEREKQEIEKDLNERKNIEMQQPKKCCKWNKCKLDAINI